MISFTYEICTTLFPNENKCHSNLILKIVNILSNSVSHIFQMKVECSLIISPFMALLFPLCILSPLYQLLLFKGSPYINSIKISFVSSF